jgi:2-keto-4-pentenoate hydratase/2-oxohepta-3-ene-1,7-dioic acid hydratase in catechol pathway
MKLARIGSLGFEKPAVILDDGTRIDVSTLIADFTPETIEGGALEKLKSADLSALPRLDAHARLGAVIKRPGKIICIGLNYAAHAAEGGMEVPTEPILFFKASSAITGPNDGIMIPKGSTQTDWEVELAVVIGTTCRHVAEENALDYVLGYCVHNDLSEREWQFLRGGQWVKGKSADTYAPLGPYLATPEEIPDPNNLALWLTVNGEKLQNSSTSDFIFQVQHVIAYLSTFMTLEAGDIISTGTPAGVGAGLKPPRYLKPGDIVELGIEGLGQQRQIAPIPLHDRRASAPDRT